MWEEKTQKELAYRQIILPATLSGNICLNQCEWIGTEVKINQIAGKKLA